jgi:hypothetical protein
MTEILSESEITSAKLVEAIYAQYKKRGDEEPNRGYLGASIIGYRCDRYLWYCFRSCCKEEIEGRIYRLFETGDLEEARLTNDLRSIGCIVHDVDENGEQFEVNAFSGHFSGHMDGAATRIPGRGEKWHVLEYKTHNAKSYAKLVANGVAKAKPMHYAQMQIYMHLTGMKHALYLAVNKDTDEIYPEFVEYDKEFADKMMDRAENIIFKKSPPDRIASRPDWWECRYCPARTICWGTENAPGEPVFPVTVNCRQCCHATPVQEPGVLWQCSRPGHERGLSPKDQDKACPYHLIIPKLLDISDTYSYKDSDGDTNESIEYVLEDGTIIRQGNGSSFWSSEELTRVTNRQMYLDILNGAKKVMGATVVSVEANPDPFE